MTGHVTLPGASWAFWPQVVLRGPGFPAAGVSRLASPLAAEAADRVIAGGSGPADAAWSSYRAGYAAEIARVSSVIQDIATDPRFQLALAWQNHRTFDTAIAPLLRNGGDPARRNGKHRAHEELIASYWQRYCVKNDSIGFFGPVGWATFDASVPASRLRAGPQLVASSEVFFETWAVDRLAETIAAEPGMSVWVAPRKRAFVRLDGQRAVGPAIVPVTLSRAEAAVLRRCTGTVPAHDIAHELAGRHPDVGSASDVYAIIDGLCRRRLITWKLELPVSPRPERELRRFLGTVGDPASAASGLAMLQRLDAARTAVREAAGDGDPGNFVGALRALDGVFAEITGSLPSRNSGKTYGARTLVYHDARRDADLVLGADFAAALAPIELLLLSARWLTYQAGIALTGSLQDVARRLEARCGGTVDLASFWFECMTVLHKTAPGVLDRLQVEFQRRWAAILACSPSQSRERRQARALRDRVQEAFDAPRSGWAAARHCSPDIMIAAPDVAAIKRGDFELILGEFHLALASCRHYCFVTQHPSPKELFACLTVDNPGPCLLPVLPKEGPGRLTGRTQPALTRDEDFLVALFDTAVDPARPRLLDAADLTVKPTADGVTVTVPGGPSFDVLDVFSEILANMIIDRFVIFPALPHVPRVSIDRLVISRETWRFPAGQLAFAAQRDEADRFLAARRWWRESSLPRWVFVKVPGEMKPYFVDFDSPVYVNLLAKSLRRLQAQAADGKNPSVTFTEMLPGPADLWFADSTGERFTSELRMIAVDLRGPLPGLPASAAALASVPAHARLPLAAGLRAGR